MLKPGYRLLRGCTYCGSSKHESECPVERSSTTDAVGSLAAILCFPFKHCRSADQLIAHLGMKVSP